MDEQRPHGEAFVDALQKYAPEYDLEVNGALVARLREYYDIVTAWNDRLHLIAPCGPEEFATRHVLESLSAIPYIEANAMLVDIGSGAGLPAIPCLIVRADLNATLVESSLKKSVFLREAISRFQLVKRASVRAVRFESFECPAAEYLTCRALDRFIDSLPELIKWSSKAKRLLLFGGDGLREQLEKLHLQYITKKLPKSDRRYLFIISPESSHKA